jgi:tyrosinase
MLSLALFLTLSLSASQALAACTSPTVRRDWRSLSHAERCRFIDVQQEFWRRNPDPATGLTAYDTNFTLVHRDNTPVAHQVPAFLPWHRRFLRDYEAALRAIDPAISLPYWNWAADNTRLNASAIWAADAFGGDGVEDGDAGMHCLRRIWSRGISVPLRAGQPAYVPDEAEVAGNITEFASGAAFDAFHKWLEPHHGTIHQGVGGFSPDLNGDMTAVENSPNEPVFWLHHAFVDRLWWLFQQQGEAAKVAYGGFPSYWASLPKNDSIWTNGGQVTDVMAPWGVTVQSAMFADADDYCYTYE